MIAPGQGGGDREVIFRLLAQVDPRSARAWEDFARMNGKTHAANGSAAKQASATMKDAYGTAIKQINAQLGGLATASRMQVGLLGQIVNSQKAAAKATRQQELGLIGAAGAMQKVASGATLLVRSFALLGSVGNQDLQKVLDTILLLEGGIAGVRGGVAAAKGLVQLGNAGGVAGAAGVGGAGLAAAASWALVIAEAISPKVREFMKDQVAGIAEQFGFDPLGRRGAATDEAGFAAAVRRDEAVGAARRSAISGLIAAGNSRVREIELIRQAHRERIDALEDERNRIRGIADAERARVQQAGVAFGQLDPAHQAGARRLAQRARFGGRLTRAESERLRSLGLDEFTGIANAADIGRARRAGFDNLAQQQLQRIAALDRQAARVQLDLNSAVQIDVKLTSDLEQVSRAVAVALEPFKREQAQRIKAEVAEALRDARIDPRSVEQLQDRFNSQGF